MLMGIIKPDGTVVSLDGIGDTLRASAVRCYEAGFLYGANENGAAIRFDPVLKTDIFLVPAAEPAPTPEPEPEPEPEPNDSLPMPAFDAQAVQDADKTNAG